MNSADAKRKNIFLFGNFGTGNLGNECTLQAFLHACRKYMPDAGLTGICSIPEDVSIRHGLHSVAINDGGREKEGERKRYATRWIRILLSRFPVEARQWMRAYRSLKSADGLILVGTGMITDEETGIWGLPYEIMKWTVVAKLRRSKVFFVSVGVERVRHRITREFFKWALSLADYRSFRDIESKRSLLDLGMRVDEDPVYPDLAYSLPRSVMPDPVREKRKPAVIGVGLLDYFGQGSQKEKGETAYASYVQKIADFIVWLLEHNHFVRILIGDMTCDNSVRRDLKECLERRGIAYDNQRIIDEPIHSLSDLLNQLSKTEMVVASRFHNVLLSLMQNRPAISISYNIKNDAIMREYGLRGYCQKIESLDVSRLIEQFRELMESASEHVPRLKEKTEEFRSASDAQCEKIFARLRQP